MEILKLLQGDKTEFEILCRKGFDAVDTDRSGELDKEEFREAIRQIFVELNVAEEFDDAEIDQGFADLDQDNSGKIDYEEFKVLVVILVEAYQAKLKEIAQEESQA